MSEFQITFRGVLPEPNLRALAEAMYQKVKGQYGRASGFHLAIIEQPSAYARSVAVSARVQLHAGPHGAIAAAEAWNENPVAAVREAFAQAYTEMNNVLPSACSSAKRANKLLLFRTRA
ncbi:MAG: hypothetical protein QM778_25560 [Myxococcales bacterium]